MNSNLYNDIILELVYINIILYIDRNLFILYYSFIIIKKGIGRGRGKEIFIEVYSIIIVTIYSNNIYYIYIYIR